MGNKKLCGILALIILMSSVFSSVIYAEPLTDVGNVAQTLIDKIETYMPKEVVGIESTDQGGEDGLGLDKVPLSSYGRYARYIFYVGELDKLVRENQTQASSWTIDSRDYHIKNIETLAPSFQGKKEMSEVFKHIMKKTEKDLSTQLQLILDSNQMTSLFKASLGGMRDNLKLWADAIRFYRDEAGMPDAEFEEESRKFDDIYLKLVQASKAAGTDLNLGFIRPEGSYDDAATVSNNILDDEGNLNSWFVEILTLSSHSEASSLELLKYKLTEPNQKVFEKYSHFRVPLQVGNDQEPIKALTRKGNKSIKMSNLGDFIEGRDAEQVLYIPMYTKPVTEPISGVEEEVQEVDISTEETEYKPVYIKGSRQGFMDFKGNFEDAQIEGETDSISFTSARMNHMQLINFYESGKLNDLQADLSYPLFMDMWGNIQTYSGKVLIPAVSNNTLLAYDEYFPLNAFFLNSYPIESGGLPVPNLFKADPTKYVVTMRDGSGEVEDGKDVNIGRVEKATFTMSRLKKNGALQSDSKIGFMDKTFNTNHLPKIRPYIEREGDTGELTTTLFMSLVDKDQDAFVPTNRHTVLGLKESMLILDNKKIPFMMINEQIPVERWNFDYFYGKDGDRKRLKNTLIAQIAESAYNNPDTDYTKLKVTDSQTINHGFKFGSLLEPLHKKISEASRNYILYTPSIAELPGVGDYLSTILIPIMKIAMLLTALFAVLRYIRHVKTMSVVNLAFSIGIILFANFALTSLYPAILNIGFNGSVSSVLGKNSYHLTLYNIEKDMNSKGEFIYTDKPTKIMSKGAYIKLANLDTNDVKRFRAGEEDAPWKDSNYYIPKWDLSHADIGDSLFIKGDTLNIYVKDLTASASVVYKDNEYQVVWEQTPEYAYYTPYLSILEGITKSINTYTKGRISPKTLEYSNGYRGESGGALAYFSNKYFLVDNESARSAGEEFLAEWERYNGGDFLNLRDVLYLNETQDENLFPSKNEQRVKFSRWYKTAMNGRSEEKAKELAWKKIQDVNLSTKQYAISLLPFMDNITDDVALKMIALHATVQFNKEFSKTPIESLAVIRDWTVGLINGTPDRDYFLTMYPKRLELDTISVDEHLKIGLVNMKDLLKFNITSIYKFVENEASWLGMLFLAINTLLLYIRSIMRITFITVILMVVLMYMIIVYALQRDYSNKTIVGMIGIIGISWVVYLIDNLLTLVFAGFDKQGAGILLLIMMIWTLWNLVATTIYVKLFVTIAKDITAFGGNIMYASASSVLDKANVVIKSGLSMVSGTRAENFDISRPDFDMKSEDFENYLGLDMEDKLERSQSDMDQFMQEGLDSFGNKIREVVPQTKTIKEMYATHQDQDEMTVIASVATPKVAREYMEDYGMSIYQDPKTSNYVISGDMKDWKGLVDNNIVSDKSFNSLYQEKDGSMYFPTSGLSTEFLDKAGVNYSDLGETLMVPRVETPKVQGMMDALNTEVYRVDMDKASALRNVEGIISTSDYELGKNALYMKNQTQAKEIFGDSVTPTHKTQYKINDYSDRLSSGGYIADSLDFLNGAMITNEYIQGNLTKSAMKSLLDDGIHITPMGGGKYKFDPENRESILNSLDGSVTYTEGKEGIIYRKKSPIDNLWVWGDESGKKEGNNKPNLDSKPVGPGQEEAATSEETITPEKEAGFEEGLLDLDLGLDD